MVCKQPAVPFDGQESSILSCKPNDRLWIKQTIKKSVNMQHYTRQVEIEE
jgi:hypothetical protein